MNLFDLIILNIVLLAFPIMLWLFYITYNKNIGKEELDLLFDFSLITSLYLIIKFGKDNPFLNILIVINIPLFMAYFKKRPSTALLISIMIIIHSYYSFNNSILILILILEYGLYYIIYLLFNNRKFSIILISILKIINYIIFVLFFYYYRQFNFYIILNLIIAILETILITFIIISLCSKIEDIIKYHMSLKELEQEKQFRMSLFRITHEIKNPIAVCKGYLDMFNVNDIKHSQKYIPILKEEIERTLILLQDFLCMTKIQIESELVDIILVLEDVLDNFIPIFKEKKINYEFNLLESDSYIYGDYNRITQVFINIIKNAIEATENKIEKKIIIKVEIINEEIKINIIDNGEGFTKEQLLRLGEPFFTTKQNGTGLGISLSQEIIKAHNGIIKYNSEVNKGTTVSIIIPIVSNN